LKSIEATYYKKYSLREKVDVKFQIDFTENTGMITSQSHLLFDYLLEASL
jgi:hypothetical protein